MIIVVLMLKVKKLDQTFLASNLGKFPLFDNFFLTLADFWDLNNFYSFNFPNFLISSILAPIN